MLAGPSTGKEERRHGVEWRRTCLRAPEPPAFPTHLQQLRERARRFPSAERQLLLAGGAPFRQVTGVRGAPTNQLVALVRLGQRDVQRCRLDLREVQGLFHSVAYRQSPFEERVVQERLFVFSLLRELQGQGEMRVQNKLHS